VGYNDLDISLNTSFGRLLLPNDRARSLQVATGPRGLESITADLPTSVAESFGLYTSLGQLTAAVAGSGQVFARGRVEDLTINDDGAQMNALGPWRELSDLPYTGFWSASGTEGWQETSNALSNGVLTNRRPEMYAFQLDEVIQISPTKGASYTNSADVGSVFFRGPNGGADRTIVGMQFRLRLLLPNNWRFQINAYTNNDWSGGVTTPLTVTSAGVLIDRAYHISGFGRRVWEMFIFNNTGGASAPAGETGSWYALISDIRIVSSATNRVNTVLTAARAAGASVTATVASTTGVYVGMQLVMNSGNTPSEIVTVESVTNATQFVATFVGSYVAGNAVQGHRVTPDEVAGSVLAFTKAANAGGVLNSSTALIQACNRDLLDASWEDTTPADIIAELAERGDGTQRFEAGAFGDGLLYFRPAGGAGLNWFVDASELSIQQTIDGLVNSVYARYQAADGRTLRTTASADAVSAARYGLTRQGVVDASTTNATIAGQVASTAVANTADPVPRAGLTVERIYTAEGAEAPLWLVRSGDTVTIRNLPPAAGSSINRIQTFRIAETRYDAVANELVIIPESPLPDLEHQQAAILRAAEAAASLSSTPAAAAITVLAPQQVRRSNPTITPALK
jgi:hypothetical protein